MPFQLPFINHLIKAASLMDKFPFGICTTSTTVFVLRCFGGRPSPKSPLCSHLVNWVRGISLDSSSLSFASVTCHLLSSAGRHFLPNHSLLWGLLSARTELIQLMGQTLSICWKNGADWIQSRQTKAGNCTGRRRRFVEILVFGRGYWWRQAKDAAFALVNTKVTLQALHF